MAIPDLHYEDKCLHKRTLRSCILHICKGGKQKRERKERKITHFLFEYTDRCGLVPASKLKPQTSIPDRCRL